jgi:hypothetical protein
MRILSIGDHSIDQRDATVSTTNEILRIECISVSRLGVNVVQVNPEVALRGQELHDEGNVNGPITTQDGLEVECTLAATLRERAVDGCEFAEHAIPNTLPDIAWH